MPGRRLGYILVSSTDEDLTLNEAVLDRISVRHLTTKEEISRIEIPPFDSVLRGGKDWITEPTCLSPDGKLYTTGYTTWDHRSICEIDIGTGIATTVLNLQTQYGMTLFIDNDYLYLLEGWAISPYHWSKYRRDTWALVDSKTFNSADVIFGYGYDGLNNWMVTCINTHKIQKRNSNWTLMNEYPYPAGFETAEFYSCQIDSQSSTRLWLQGKMGTKGIIIIVDILDLTRVVEYYETPDILRWQNQQFAIGGAAVEKNSIEPFTPPTVTGTTLMPSFFKGNDEYWDVQSAAYALIDPITGITGPFHNCSHGSGDSGLIGRFGKIDGGLTNYSWKAGDDLPAGLDQLGVFAQCFKKV